MEVRFERCCGIDVHKKKVVACLLTGRKKEIREFGTMTDELLTMCQWLKENDCDVVAMESTRVTGSPYCLIIFPLGLG